MNFRNMYTISALRRGSLLLLLLLISFFSWSQCSNPSAFGTATAPTSSTPITITTCAFGGEYNTINSAVAGSTYQFVGTGGTGNFLTIRQGTPGGSVLAFGFSPVNATCTVSGQIFCHINTNASCGTESSCHTTTIACTSCSGPPDPCTSITSVSCGTATSITLSGSGLYNPLSCGFSTPGNEKVYSFVAPSTGIYTLQVTSTSSTGYIDYFYKAASGGCSGTGWTCILDIFSPTTATIGTLTAGTTYYIMLDEETTSSVTHTFQINCPVYDPCSSIATITCGTAVTSTPTGSGVWNPLNCGFSTPGQEKVYSFTPATTGAYSLQVTSATGGYIDYFYKAASGGCNSTGWTCIKDISSPTTWPIATLTAGVQYYFLLDPEGTGSYSHTFNIACVAADPCTAISTISCASPTSITLTGAGSWNNSYCGFSLPGNEKVYSFTAPTTGVYTLQVSSTSSTGYIDYGYKAASGGCSSTGWTCIKDVFSPTTWTIGSLVAGTQYYIVLDAETTSSVTQTFSILCPTPTISLTCPSATTVACAASVPPANPGSVTGITNCANPTVTVTFVSDVISAQTCANKYTITRTYLGTDVCGNSATCQQIITVNDNVAPTLLTCPAAVTVTCAALVPAVNTALVTASDNCAGAVTISFISDVISGQTCANRYTITRTYRATDICGNFTNCVQTITVSDFTVPTLTCPNPITLTCASQVPAPAPGTVPASDNCVGAVTVTFVSDVISSQTCTNKYSIFRTYRATDVCGNSATCGQVITVNDVLPPSINCPQDIVVSCASQVPASNTSLVTASDNCGGTVTVAFVSDVVSNQICDNRYTITRTYRATDLCGNSSTCSQTITVNDITKPQIVGVPANVVIECDKPIPPVPTVVATDNCGGTVTLTYTQTSTQSPWSSQCESIAYLITRTWVATDACGNNTSKVQTIKVQDTKPPSFISTPPANITVECEEDGSNNQDPIPYDACDKNPTMLLDIKYIPYLNDCVNSYTVINTWTAGDRCGNTVKFVQHIYVVDTEAPVIKCPSNILIYSQTPVPVTWVTPTADDYCDGAITCVQTAGPPNGSTFQPGTITTITYTATDGCGNRSTCTFTVTVLKQIGKEGYIDLTAVNYDGVAELYQNVPNPFESNTKISFSLPKDQEATITVYNVDGKVVKEVKGEFNKGINEINIQDGDLSASGMYFYELRTNGLTQTKKMFFIK